MRTREVLWLAAGLLLLAAGKPRAEAGFADLNVDDIRQEAQDYRRKANVLRKRVGIHAAKASAAQMQANQIIQSAQALQTQQLESANISQQNAQSNQAVLGVIAGFLPGSNLGKIGATVLTNAGNKQVVAANGEAQIAANQGAGEVAQAQEQAAPLVQEAKKLEGEQQKLALRANQFERMADAKDLLAAAETLRKQAEDGTKHAADRQATIADYKQFVQDLDIW